jgi:hypothetical protein
MQCIFAAFFLLNLYKNLGTIQETLTLGIINCFMRGGSEQIELTDSNKVSWKIYIIVVV